MFLQCLTVDEVDRTVDMARILGSNHAKEGYY